MLQRVTLRRSDVIVPVFVREGTGVRRKSLPCPASTRCRLTLRPLAVQRAEEGFGSYLIFGVIDRSKKDPSGSAALDEDNVVCKLLRAVKAKGIPMLGVTDLCFCEYTSHGHCGPMTEDGATVKNDETVSRLVRQAVNHAKAGEEIMAPSGMMDGTVGRFAADWMRRGLKRCRFWPMR